MEPQTTEPAAPATIPPAAPTAPANEPDRIRVVQDDAGNKYVPIAQFEQVQSDLSATQQRVSDLEAAQSQSVTITKPEPDPELEEQAAADELDEGTGEAGDESIGVVVDTDPEQVAKETHGVSDGEGLEPQRFIKGL